MSTQRPSAPTPPTDTVSRESGRYLLELYFASIETDQRVRTGTLSERLDVHPASVTEMVSKLAVDGYVDHEKHEGTRLTPSGQEVAEVLAWRYCVTERFFIDELDTPVDRPTIYRIGFELPVDGLVTLAESVDIPCMRACSRMEQTAQHSDCSISDA
jgi:DtxR family Mn-dependent transcriptional regulator